MKRVEIQICLGSSCFARGNQTLVHRIKEHLLKLRLTDQVIFKGAHCFNQCKDGPMLRINDEIISGVNENNIAEVLNIYLKKHDIKIS